MKKSTRITLAILAVSCIALIFSNMINEAFPEQEPLKECTIVKRDTIYLAVGEQYELPEGEYTTNSPNITLEGSRIKAVKEGNAIIKSECEVIPVTISDLYTLPVIDNSKEFLPCGLYSREQNEFLDMIMLNKIKEGGIRTRAGAVACARFMSLQFRYRLPYFYENGRLSGISASVDGEGRFYHKGLYLNEYKYDVIGYPSMGPATWGCPVYSYELKSNVANGFDCSGYISWILYNAGYDPGDIGAGPSADIKDLTDLGDVVRLKDLDMNDVKAGDLLGFEGHIAMIIGINDGKLYIGESYWEGDLNVEEISFSDFLKSREWSYVILMDDFYKLDGSYTAFWE